MTIAIGRLTVNINPSMPASDKTSDNLHDEHREEVRNIRHVAVNPLDHLAGRFHIMKSHIQPQAMLQKIAAKPVCRAP